MRAPWVAAAIVAVAAAALLAPVLPDPIGRAFGLPGGEGPAHLWGLWVAADGIRAHGPYLRSAPVNHPLGFEADLVDPVNLLAIWPALRAAGGRGGGAVLGWNAVHGLAIALAGWGAWRAAAAVSPTARLVVVASVVAAPVLQGGAVLGRSEWLALAWIPLLWSFVRDAAVEGGRPHHRAGAALVLLALLHSGWLVAAVAIAVALAGAAISGRRALGPVAVALAGAVPGVVTTLRADPWWLSRLSEPSPFSLRPVAVPLSALVRLPSAPSWDALELAPYPGLAVLLLALAGVLVRPRRALLPFLAALGILIAAVGPVAAFGAPDAPVRLWMPMAALAHLLPPLRAVYAWSRFGVLVAFPLGLAAAHLVDRARERRPAVGTVVAFVAPVLVLADGLSWKPHGTGWFAVEPPGELTALLERVPEGAILEIPVDAKGEGLGAARIRGREDLSLLWERSHGRPTSEAPSPVRAAALELSAVAAALDRGIAPARDPCAAGEAHRLARAGFSAVVLDRARSPDPATAGRVRELLGPPFHEGPGFVAWKVEPGGAPALPCGRDRPSAG